MMNVTSESCALLINISLQGPRIAELHFAMNIAGDNLRTGELTV